MKSKRRKPKGYAVQIELEQVRALRAIKERDGITLSAQLKRAIDMWLRSRKK